VRLLAINEVVPSNETVVQDEAGDFDPWLEIFNPLPVDVGVGNLALTDEELNPLKWVFPDTNIGGLGFLVVWADGEPAEGPYHTNFSFAAEGGWLGLSEVQSQQPIFAVVCPAMEPNIAWAQVPDRSGSWVATSIPTPGVTNLADSPPPVLFINEFLASNDSDHQDELGEFDDWAEIYNPGPEAVQMGGLFLTDDLENSTKWVFPEIELAPGEFLLVWCDQEVTQGPLHASFKLSASGEGLGLFDRIDNGNGLIDGYNFGPQTTDISEGRHSDGGLPWIFFPGPTPGASNNGASGLPGTGPSSLVLLPNYPNPFNPQTTIGFDLPSEQAVSLRVYDISGRLVGVVIDNETVAQGRNEVVWRGRDMAGRMVSAGVYFYRLEAGEYSETKRMALIK